MAKYYIIPMDDSFEPKGRIRFRSVDVKTMKSAKEITLSEYLCMTFDKPHRIFIVEEVEPGGKSKSSQTL